MMNKTKLLSVAVIVLLMLNFGILAFLMLSKNHKPTGRKMPKEIIIEKLHFNENQIENYSSLIKKHQDKIKSIEYNIQKTKNALYLKLNDKTMNSKVVDSLIKKLTFYQKEIEITHFTHFIEIKNLCLENQLQDYKNLTSELAQLFSKPPMLKN